MRGGGGGGGEPEQVRGTMWDDDANEIVRTQTE